MSTYERKFRARCFILVIKIRLPIPLCPWNVDGGGRSTEAGVTTVGRIRIHEVISRDRIDCDRGKCIERLRNERGPIEIGQIRPARPWVVHIVGDLTKRSTPLNPV